MMLALGITMLFPDLKPISWPQTPGTIISHRVEKAGASQQAVVVRYSYEVNGTRYRSEAFSHRSKPLTAPSNSPEEADKQYRTNPAYSGYQHGKKVTVYYDPADPGKSVLKRGVGFVEIGLLLLGVLLLGGALSERRRLNTLATAKNTPSTG